MQYKLVGLNTTKRFQNIDACQDACLKHGMALMSLESDGDRVAIWNIPNYQLLSDRLVITYGLEDLDTSGTSTFSSRPGGTHVSFISLTSTIGKRQTNTPGRYTINIYFGSYYSRDMVVDKDDLCACRSDGEW